MRASAVLLAVCVVGCFSDAPSGGSDATDGGSSTGSLETTGGSGSTTSSQTSSSASGTSDASSSSDASSESSSGVPSVCGNGVVEAGEPCDDADNADPLDGCLVGCRLGPIGIDIVEGDAPRPVGQQGAVDQSHSCLGDAANRALEGLAGGLGGPGDGDTWPTGLGGTCLQLSLSEQDGAITIVASPSDPDLPTYGGGSGSQGTWSLACPAGTIPIGVRAPVYAHTTPYLKGIALECATATVTVDEDPPRVVLSNAVTTAYTPGDGAGTLGDSICAQDHVAIGFRGRITALPAVEDLGPRCGRIELVFPE